MYNTKNAEGLVFFFGKVRVAELFEEAMIPSVFPTFPHLLRIFLPHFPPPIFFVFISRVAELEDACLRASKFLIFYFLF